MTLNAQYQYVRTGNAGMLDGNAASGSGMVSDSFTMLFVTRGTIDLNENRLPIANDCTVRPTDPILLYDAFVVTASGTPKSGIVGPTALNVGDLLVLAIDADATVATNWLAVVNTALQLPSSASSSAYNGQLPKVRVINTRLPFFP